MKPVDPEFSRISKLFVDRDQTSGADAMQKRKEHVIVLRCGQDISTSATLQLAVLTAARLAARCFPDAVRIVAESELSKMPMLAWPDCTQSFGDILANSLSASAFDPVESINGRKTSLVFGQCDNESDALRITFDGWIAKVGPCSSTPRLQEREFCPLAGLLAASLGVSEAFLSFAGISLEATRRTRALSLWRPDLPADDADALGSPLQFLPLEIWLLGLGHLGNAYAWALAALPYRKNYQATLYLMDYDTVEDSNLETCVLFDDSDLHEFKTRACAKWLEDRGFLTRIVERPLDENFRCREDEPRLALCGFDTNSARRNLETAGFLRIIESGLGDTKYNFDTISLHTLPNPRSVDALWPELDEEQKEQRKLERERLARENAGYLNLGGDECGRIELAGKSVAVPFVGLTAATFTIAETLRVFHENGSHYSDLKIRLGTLNGISSQRAGNYSPLDSVGLRNIAIGDQAADQ